MRQIKLCASLHIEPLIVSTNWQNSTLVAHPKGEILLSLRSKSITSLYLNHRLSVICSKIMIKFSASSAKLNPSIPIIPLLMKTILNHITKITTASIKLNSKQTKLTNSKLHLALMTSKKVKDRGRKKRKEISSNRNKNKKNNYH